MNVEVYDIETLINCFTYTGYNFHTKQYVQFVIWNDSWNEIKELIKHLKSLDLQIGYNNESFDYPVIHYILMNEHKFSNLSGEEIASLIYIKAQEVINTDFTRIWDNQKIIKQLDLYLIWHYDNKAKATSLKALEIAMNLELVEDMPYEHNYYISELEEVFEILHYNKHDVFATKEFLNITLGNTNNPLYKGKNKIELRNKVKQKYNLPCDNYNDIKLGTELILKLYCDKFNHNIKEIKQLRTPRKKINLGDCLPKWTNFESKEFHKLVDKFKSTNIINAELKGKLEFSVIYNNIRLDYGAGGCHACIKPGIYNATEDIIILDIDADGLYPCLAIQQGLYPKHLGNQFLDIYAGEIVNVRLAEKKKPKKERDFVIVEGFKLAANGTYGKSNSNDSWMYDPLYTLKTTISGQIMISMWIEKLCKSIDNLTILQVNTDGITLMFNRKDYQKAIDATSEMTRITGLTYEFNEYSRMVIRDVNNYSSRYSIDNKIKHKGALEIDKELHKDQSMRIVAIALEKYFFYNIPIEETIRNHKNIYDFCLRLKKNNSSKAIFTSIRDERLHQLELGKNTRYYVSKKGGSLSMYYNGSDSQSKVNKGFVVTLFNQFEQKEDYGINYSFYEIETRKIINSIEDKQLNLF